jgi:hypothetical protein
MSSLKTLSMVLLLSGLAAAQATVIGGTASNWVPAYGVYAAPFVPLVTTPSVTLATVSPSAVGASNATFGNVAGATNATLSFVSQPPAGAYTRRFGLRHTLSRAGSVHPQRRRQLKLCLRADPDGERMHSTSASRHGKPSRVQLI